MGAYLSSPVTEKDISTGAGKDVKYGVSAMQGWRRTMEDCHVADVSLDSDQDVQLFGVFDGHGGAEVARFAAKHLGAELVKNPNYGKANFEGALVEAFHQIDTLLRNPQYASEIETYKNKVGGDEPEEETMENSPDKKDGNNPMTTIELLKKLLTMHSQSAGQQRPGQDAQENASGASSSTDEAMQSSPPSQEWVIQAGCAAVVMLKKGTTMYVANAGDSRAVMCRSGKAIALTIDHKPTSDSERKRIEAAGGFVSDIGGICRVNGNLNLSRAIGDLRYKTNDKIAASKQIITAQPDVYKYALKSDDEFVILACDGIWDCMSNQEAVNFVRTRLQKGAPLEQIHEEILDECLAADPKDTKGVGCDNMTIIIVVLNSDQQPQQPTAAPAATNSK